METVDNASGNRRPRCWRFAVHCLAAVVIAAGSAAIPVLASEGAASDVLLAALDGRPAGSQDAVPDHALEEVVRELQRELGVLDLYDGPVNGRVTAELEDAMARFESRFGTAATGPTADLLRRLRSMAEAARLQATLEAVRRAETARAMHALHGAPATRDLVDRSQSPGRNASGSPGDTARCRARPDVDCLLAEALSHALSVDRVEYRDWALRGVIEAFVETGRHAAAREQMRAFDDPRLILVALRETAAATARQGRPDEALRLAESIPDASNRVRAMADIAAAFARRGDAARAERLAKDVLVELERDQAISGRVSIAAGLAPALADAGRSDFARRAIEVARRMASASTSEVVRYAELGMITAALAKSGEIAAAREAIAQIAAGNVPTDAAAEAARYRVAALCSLAEAATGNADPTATAALLFEAETAATALRAGYAGAYARSRIAEAWMAVGQLEQGERMVLEIDNESLRARGLWRLVMARTGAGDREAALVAEQRARAATRGVDSGFDRTIIFAEAATALLDAGELAGAKRVFDDALAESVALTEPWWRARALARTAMALHRIGQIATSPAANP